MDNTNDNEKKIDVPVEEIAEASTADSEVTAESDAPSAQEVVPAAEESGEGSMSAEEAQNEFIEEFAPDPIVIPKYNKEKEQIKRDKAKEKTKKQSTKKSKKRRRRLRKIIVAIRTVFLFVLLLCVVAAVFASVVVRTNTTNYAIKSAISSSEPERFIIGEIKYPEKLMLKESSDYASVADILRDNSIIPIAYEDIERAVKRSSYPAFVADASARVVRHLVYGEKYKEITVDEITDLLYKNVTQIEFVTGQKLGESACINLASYIAKSPALNELKGASLAKQPSAQNTYITSVIFSLPVLIAAVILLVILLVLIIMACNGYAHRMIGWVLMLCGIAGGVAGYLFKPFFTPSSDFVKSVVAVLVRSFNNSALVYGVVVFVAGLIVVLVGSAMSDAAKEEDEDENEDGYDDDSYIDEIEQVVTSK